MKRPILPCQIEFVHRHGIKFRTAITEDGQAEWVLLEDIASAYGTTLHELDSFMGTVTYCVEPLEIFVYHVNLGMKLALDMGSAKDVIDALETYLPGGKEQ